jgi:probable HAF family extracellular repeat protein
MLCFKIKYLRGVIMTMFQQLNRTFLKSALISSALLLTSINVNAASYNLTDLGVNTTPTAINNLGQAVGVTSLPSGSISPTIWAVSVPSDPGANTRGINDAGHVAGFQAGRATLTNGTSVTVLDNSVSSPPITTGSQAYDVNNADQAVGSSYSVTNNNINTYVSRATLWSGGTTTDLGTLGGKSSFAFDINNSGQIVGYSNPTLGSFATHATLWSGGIATDLDTLGGFSSAAVGINDAGQIVGTAEIPGNNLRHGVLWDSGKMIDLGALAGGYSEANAINNLGQIVGTSDGKAFLWEKGVMTDLNSLVNLSLGGFILNNARGINDLGWIFGDAYDSRTNTAHGYVLTLANNNPNPNPNPSNVPVPAAAWLFASGLGAFGVAKRRSKKV